MPKRNAKRKDGAVMAWGLVLDGKLLRWTQPTRYGRIALHVGESCVRVEIRIAKKKRSVKRGK